MQGGGCSAYGSLRRPARVAAGQSLACGELDRDEDDGHVDEEHCHEEVGLIALDEAVAVRALVQTAKYGTAVSSWWAQVWDSSQQLVGPDRRPPAAAVAGRGLLCRGSGVAAALSAGSPEAGSPEAGRGDHLPKNMIMPNPKRQKVTSRRSGLSSRSRPPLYLGGARTAVS